MNKILTVVIPTYNEEKNLPALFDAIEFLSDGLETRSVALEIVVVDNTSNDRTWEHLNLWAASQTDHSAIRLYQHPVNLGMQQSLLSGLRLSRGDAIVVMQSDLQDPPRVVLDMVDAWQSGASLVATRISRRQGAWIPRLGAWGFYRLLKIFSDTPILSDSSDFYLFDARFREAAIQHSGSTPFLRATLTSLAKPDAILSYIREDRQQGDSNFNLRRRVNFAFDALLRDLGGLVKRVTLGALAVGGLAILGLATLGFAYIFGYRSPVGGWLTSTALLLIVLGTLMFLGALALELLHRIYRDIPRQDFSLGGKLREYAGMQ